MILMPEGRLSHLGKNQARGFSDPFKVCTYVIGASNLW